MELEVARWWGITRPSEWDALSEEDKVEMMANYNVMDVRERWGNYLHNEELERISRKSGK